MSEETLQLAEGYTSQQAAEIMTRSRINKFKQDNNRQELTEEELAALKVEPDYVRKLVEKRKIRAVKVNNRLSLYNKEDVEGYIVEDRGKKAGRAAQTRAKYGTTTKARTTKPRVDAAE